MSQHIPPNNNTITTADTRISPSQNIVVNGGLGYPPNQVHYVGGGDYVGPLGTVNITTGIADPTWATATKIQCGQLELKGNQADVVINGVSLTETLQLIQDRLCMLRPNRELEQEWDQLRDLGDQYRELEKQLMEKQRAWDLLRKKQG